MCKYYTRLCSNIDIEKSLYTSGNFVFLIKREDVDTYTPNYDKLKNYYSYYDKIIPGIVLNRDTIILQNGSFYSTTEIEESVLNKDKYATFTVAYAITGVKGGFTTARDKLIQYLKYGKDAEAEWHMTYINPDLPRVMSKHEIEEVLGYKIIIKE